MKKFFRPMLAAMILGGLLCAPLVRDLQGQTLDEVLARNFQAHGGLDRLKSLTGWKMTGKMIIPAQGLEMPVAMWQKSPNKMRVESIFQSRKIVQACDGQKTWWIMPFLSEEAQEMPEEQGKLFRDQADFENPLVVYKEKGYTLELLGKEEMDGTPVFKLKLIRTDGRETCFYLDAESGIELKSAMQVKTGGTEALVEILYSDYRPVDGCMRPFVIENKANGHVQMRMVIAAVEINPALDDAFFAMPGNKIVPPVEARK
ncbi:MAG: hypothetical protein PHX05_08120 [Acidobacteriota bacterium]|nr:hypothetical protein [Acidobacteriota bacterium]